VSDLGGTVALGSATVHRMGYGAMQLAGPGVFGPPRDRDEALRVLRRTRELGIDHLDTSQYYGPDVVNALIREALYPYEGLTLVSKVGARRDDTGGWHHWNRPQDLRQGIEDNLRGLGVDNLPVVNLRLVDAPTEGLDEKLDAMIQARDEGLIGAIGLSNVDLEQLLFCLERTEVACVQNSFNLIDRSAQPVLDECTRRSIAFVPFFPLGSGMGVNDVRGHPAVVAASARMGATPSQVALAWTLAQSPVVALIPGTSSVTHLEENVAAAALALGETDII